MKKNEEIIAQHIAKLETEMHSRFRLTEEASQQKYLL